jgi:hypothetical protein
MIKYPILLCVFVFLLAASCSKKSQNSVLQVKLTDAPGDYEQVLIDVQDVQVHASSI